MQATRWIKAVDLASQLQSNAEEMTALIIAGVLPGRYEAGEYWVAVPAVSFTLDVDSATLEIPIRSRRPKSTGRDAARRRHISIRPHQLPAARVAMERLSAALLDPSGQPPDCRPLLPHRLDPSNWLDTRDALAVIIETLHVEP